jgi:hypothetical protein
VWGFGNAHTRSVHVLAECGVEQKHFVCPPLELISCRTVAGWNTDTIRRLISRGAQL